MFYLADYIITNERNQRLGAKLFSHKIIRRMFNSILKNRDWNEKESSLFLNIESEI